METKHHGKAFRSSLADVPFPRATKEIGDVCAQAKLPLNRKTLFEHQKKSLAGFVGRVSTWIRNANACVADKRVGDLESVRTELDAAWERYDSFYENYIAKKLPEGELDGVKDRYTEIVVQYEGCTIRINDCLEQIKKTSTKGKSELKQRLLRNNRD